MPLTAPTPVLLPLTRPGPRHTAADVGMHSPAVTTSAASACLALEPCAIAGSAGVDEGAGRPGTWTATCVQHGTVEHPPGPDDAAEPCVREFRRHGGPGGLKGLFTDPVDAPIDSLRHKPA